MTTRHTLDPKKMESASDKQSVTDLEVGDLSRSIDMVPGTRLLLGQGQNSLGSSGIILSPEPSSDPDDPLNWSALRKSLSFFVVNLYSFMVAVVALSTAVTYGALIAEFHTTAAYLNVGTALSILFIGMGNIIWNPLVSFSGQTLRTAHNLNWKASDSSDPQLLACLLFVSVFVVLMPTAFAQAVSETDKNKAATLKMSRISALIVLLIYVLYFVHEIRTRPVKGNDVESQTYDPESGSTSSTNYRSGSVDLGSSSFSSQHLPSRTIRFADDQDRERRSDSIYKLNNIAELETVEPSVVGDMMMDRGRRSGETPRSSSTRPNSYQPLLNSRTHSRSISVSSSIGLQSRDSSMSRASRHTTALHLLREHRLSMDQLVHPRSHAEHSETDWKVPVAMLIITSLLMSMCGEFLVSTIDDITHDDGLSEPLIGLVILPIVGNVAEYVTVVAVAIRGNIDLATAVAVGSSIQIALCISPLTVMAGWAMRKNLDLAFNTFEMVTLAGTVLLVNLLILNDGSSSLKTSGLKGALMCACYVMFGVGAFLYP